ncbi:MAG: isoprenylcysteine carboxylmethyltransferase family protein [Actinomycetia bacterium]|nr:isoprenylcysteine carboxylmethyltransferase family protein [Actinomycetes bacterium]
MEKFLNYIQVFLLAFFLCFIIGKTIYIKRKNKINPIALNIRRDGIRHILEIILFLIVNIWSFEVLFYALNLEFRIFGWPLNIKLFETNYLRFLGLALIIIGFILFVWALINLGTSWRLGIDETRPGKLVKFGIYRYCRHPIYVFFNLYFLGTFLIWANLIFLILWITVAAILHYQAIAEERFLTKIYTQQYQNYKENVGRYISVKPSVYRQFSKELEE